MYFKRGYAFHAYKYDRHQTSVNYGVGVREDIDFYEIIQEIIEITFPGRRYNKFEPFILASQAEQVIFIPYPRLKPTGIHWLSVIKIAPRGYIVREEESTLQNNTPVDIPSPELSTYMVLLVDPHNREDEEVNEDEEVEETDEFDESDSEDEYESNDDSE
ncbi:unnamed protein product [Cochlearia groenlandica]